MGSPSDDSINAIKSNILKELVDIEHAFFTREGGRSDGIYGSLNIGLGSNDNREAVLENRKLCARHLGQNLEKLTTPYQIHSSTAVVVDKPWLQGDGPKADAVITKTPGIVVGIATADCGPVLFADDGAGVVAAAHAGWRGATSGVLDNTIAAMESLGASRSNINAVLGPTIAQKSYEVGPEFVERLVEEDTKNEVYFVPSTQANHAMFDLPAFIVDRLKKLGVAHAESLELDTYEDEKRFFSYRRTTHRKEADYGRLLSAIVIKE